MKENTRLLISLVFSFESLSNKNIYDKIGLLVNQSKIKGEV